MTASQEIALRRQALETAMLINGVNPNVNGPSQSFDLSQVLADADVVYAWLTKKG